MFDDYIQAIIYTTSESLLLGFTQCQKVCFEMCKSQVEALRGNWGENKSNVNFGEQVKRGLARTIFLDSLFFLSVKNQGQNE